MGITLNKIIKVLVVDDSAVVRQILSRELDKVKSIEVVGTAPDPYIAKNKIISLEPDVLTLDVEMPRMDGITFLKKLMKARPMPVIVLSSLTQKGSKTAMEALSAGAVDIIAKPGGSFTVQDTCEELVKKIKVASTANISKAKQKKPRVQNPHLNMAETTNKIFAIGASTGGVKAVTTVIKSFPSNAPGILVVQHMPAAFTSSFAERLNCDSAVKVKEAEDGDRIIPGKVLIAPGNYHMLLRRSGANYKVQVKSGPHVCHQRPSVEVMFNSVAKYAGANAIGAILTGMGADGAKGLLNMKKAGAHTVAQNEESCVVFGMPKEAIKLGAAEQVIELGKVAETMIDLASKK